MPDHVDAFPKPTGSRGSRRATLTVVLAAPRGFCAGVRRAVTAVESALEQLGRPVYVRRAIVHNATVVRSLEQQGAVFVDELSAVPAGAVVILSAHGVPLAVKADAARLGLRYLDAVCPLVAKVHREVVKHYRAGRHVVLIGHAGHPEIIGTLGQLPLGAATVVAKPGDVARLEFACDAALAYATQTTFSVDETAVMVNALKRRFPGIAGPANSDICYATTNRQAAVKQLAPDVDAIIVAGAPFSSNACRLAEVAKAAGCLSVQLVAKASQIDWPSLAGCRSVGITAAASTPECTVDAILDRLAERFDLDVQEFGDQQEDAAFKPLRLDRAALPS